VTVSAALRPVLDRLARLRRRVRRVALVSGVARVVTIAVGLLALSFVADWALDLPLGVRRFLRFGLLDRPPGLPFVVWVAAAVGCLLAALSALRRRFDAGAPFLAFLAAGEAGIAAWAVLRFAVPPLHLHPTDESLALRVEARFRSLNDRLAAALDFDRELAHPVRGESPAMMQHVVEEAGEAVRGIEVEAVASGRPAARRAATAALAVAAFAIVLLATPATAALWARRSLLLEDVAWPRATTLVAVVRDAAGVESEQDPAVSYVAALGQSLTVLARAKGRVPDEVEILDRVLSESGGKPLVHRMRAVPGSAGLFEHEFRDVRGDFTFAFRGGDDRDEEPTWRVSVTIPPRVSALRSDLVFPAYLKLAPRRIEGGALTVPEGTAVAVTFETDTPAERVEAFLDERSVATEEVAGGGAKGAPAWKFRFEAAKSLRYRIHVVTKDGRENDPGLDSYEVAVLPDAPPRPEWVWPRTPVETSPAGRVPLFGRTSDDHGVASLALETRTGAGGEPVRTPLVARGGEAADGANDRPFGAAEILTYVPLEVSALRDPTGAAPAAPSRVQARLVATDTKGQEGAGEWASIDVVRADEIERRLSTQRASVKSDLEGVRTELKSLRDRAADTGQGAIGDPERAELREIQFKQGKLATDLDRAVRSISAFFLHYAYDRLGAAAPTERVLAILDRRHRALFARSEASPAGTEGAEASGDLEVFPWSLFREVVRARRSKEVFDTGVLDRMIAVLESGIVAAADLAPVAQTAAAEAASRAGPTEIGALVAAQDALAKELDATLAALAEWQSLAELTQTVRRLIEQQQRVDEQLQRMRSPEPSGDRPGGTRTPPR
jgi:hypothetical protein